MVKSGITREELIGWGGVETFNQGLALCNSGDVHDVSYDDDTLTVTGYVDLPDGFPMKVSCTLGAGGRVTSHCPCYTNKAQGKICFHTLAIGIALMVSEMDDEPDDGARPSAGARGDEDASAPDKDDDAIEVPMKPRFYAYVSGSRASLSIELDAHYGEVEFPACSFQPDRTVWLEDPADQLVRRTRSLETEKAAMKELAEWGFHEGYSEGDLKLYVTDPKSVLNFLGAGVPALRRRNNWHIDYSPRLDTLVESMIPVVPVVTIRDAPAGAFDVSYLFDARGESLSPVEIQAALNRHDAYILKDGRVFLLDNLAIEEMHDVFRDCATKQGDAARGWFRVSGVHAPYVKASLDELGIELEADEAQVWLRNASERNREANARFAPVALGQLENTLRPYQKQGVYWMRFLESSGLGGLLADEMGLGKTLQTLTWLSLPRDGGGPRLPAIVVCPTSLVRNWEAEARKFTPWMRTLVISGPDRAESFSRIPDADLVITSYALIQRDFESAYANREFSVAVLDEAQHIKNRQTKNAQAVKLLTTRRRLVLTGTPVENSVADVWSIFDFLMPGYLGDYESFKEGYELPIADGGSAAEEAQARLKRKLHPFILRRLKQTVAKDLPDKIVKVSYCPMDEDSQRDYLGALAKTRRQVGDMVRAKGLDKSRFEILAMLMRLRQIAAVAKLDAFLEQLRSAIEGGHKILVFSQFVKMLQLIAAELQKEGIRFCYLDGSTKDRLGECNRFNRSPDIPVFLISLMAGGTGLNLTGADMVIHYDPWWNPAVEDQATDRAHRIGQKKTVYVMKMIASGSIEEKVLALQHRKRAVIAATVSTTDSAVMEKLTSEDLAELLT